jgi:predicted phosphodiesterase
MKFKLVSDLHLEFYRGATEWEPEQLPYDNEIVLLLAGDINTGLKAAPWLKTMCERYKHVVYILGNHEFYAHEWHEVKDGWKKLEMPDNFTFLDDDVLYLDGVRVLGGTLWTLVQDQTKDFGGTVWKGQQRMTDYRVAKIRVGNEYKRLDVGTTIRAHKDTVKFLTAELEKPYEGKTVVMTHHLPAMACVAERFKGDELNAFFVTKLEYLMEAYAIDVWCHGHTHDKVDTVVHNTRVLCNPRGYPGVQLNNEYIEDLTFEL